MASITSLLLAAALTVPLLSPNAATAAFPDRVVIAAADTIAKVEGEIRKVDPGNRKLTIRHGELKAYDMPAMTMVFQVKDPAMIEMVKAGDKVVFRAEKINGAFTVTDIEVVK
jgi:Cu/Ag efflux protein CusF